MKMLIFVAAVINRKREHISMDAPAGPEPDAKRLRYNGKRPPRGSHGCAGVEFWDNVFRRVESEVPRVGKRVFVAGDEFDEIQRGGFWF